MAMLSNALAIIGFIILIVIVVWGLVRIASLSTGSLSDLFGSKPKVEVTAPKTAVSGQPIALTWKYTGKEVGTFSFLYQCAENFQFVTSVPGNASNAVTKIPCGAAISVGSSTAATVIPSSTATSPVSVPVTIVFTSQDGNTRAEGSATISVTPGSATPPVQPPPPPPTSGGTPKPKPTTKPTTYTPTVRRQVALVPHAASGPTDLAVRMITAGVIDPSGALINRAPISPLEIMAIEFDVANVGGTSTGNWYFTAQLPTGPTNYLYVSPVQISLKPGEHIVYVLRFSPNMRGGAASVQIDPANRVIEANETNNMVSQPI